MNKYLPWLVTPQFLNCSVPALVYWLPESGRGAFRAEYPVAQAVIKQVAYAEPNWDGYGASPISTEAKENALRAIKSLLPVAPTPEISPNPNGTLSFEWETEEGRAHMEIGRTLYSFYVSPRVGPPVLFEGLAEDVNSIHGNLVASFLFPPATATGPLTPIEYGANVRLTD